MIKEMDGGMFVLKLLMFTKLVKILKNLALILPVSQVL
jgi:hypothetical protein